MKKLKCFIASSFGSTQVDDIYLHTILPTLVKLNITPLRVDRINHNKKIDAKIIELIQSCDFGIADLTFARPSVYFEAGFLEGIGNEVIYLTRKDHFIGKPDDKFGIEKIHFDLITKNIIGWTSPTQELERILVSRIKLVIKPLLKNQQIIDQQTHEHLQFQAYSLSDRLKILENYLIKYIKKNRFKDLILKHFWMRKMFERKDIRIIFDVYESVTINDIRSMREDISIISEKGNKQVIGLICSLTSIPVSRIEKGLFLFKQESSNLFTHNNNKIYILDSIKSEPSFLKKLQALKI
jgi:hypothetical protein